MRMPVSFCGASVLLLAMLLPSSGCSREETPPPPPPWILLITLDTTRADAMNPTLTPAFEAVARDGRRFTRAHATVPETLPSHASMMTGLYPGGHRVHENGRFLTAGHPVLAEELKKAGYNTGAVVSAFVLAKRFGLARGFDVYDDELPEKASERNGAATTDRAIAHVKTLGADKPAFLWTHYFDAHYPYAPPEANLTAAGGHPYLGEVAFADSQMGRLITAFKAAAAGAGRDAAVVVTSDHGEGLGDHGEAQHGNLVYQSTMHVPLAMSGPGLAAGEEETPVSTRRIFHTIMDWAGRSTPESLRAPQVTPEVVLGEAMKPHLQYGWQPQIMAVEGTQKAILAGPTEVYDLENDPKESTDLKSAATLPASIRTAMEDYPVPSLSAPAAAPSTLDAEAKQKLASLGYVSATATPTVRKDAPRPVDMAHLFPVIDEASGLFVQQRYAQVIPLLQKILKADPNHLDATMRLATAHSALGQEAPALAAFKRAQTLAPESEDVKLYLALHHAKGPRWPQAVPLLEGILGNTPERLPALETLALLREREGKRVESLNLFRKVFELRPPTDVEAIRFGQLAMSLGQTDQAIWGYERAREGQGAAFVGDLELGVLYLAARRLEDARQSFDRIPSSHPDYPMVLFKRAQVSVLLNEPDSAARIAAARRGADATTRPLIEKERLFTGRH
ncbi:MAG: sulfatase-like hydrolase/transferase [Acidobacteria bacterium]|nr:sulfatase-like hydrolase/transferase [Acidobacteriota bacterium]